MKIKKEYYDKILYDSVHENIYIHVSRHPVTGLIVPDEDGYVEVVVRKIIEDTDTAVIVKLGSAKYSEKTKDWIYSKRAKCWTCRIPKSQIAM